MINPLPLTLKRLREQRNITQQEMAKLINVSQRAYSHYETGESEPKIDRLITLADFYNVPIDVLVGRYTMPGLLDSNEQEKDADGNSIARKRPGRPRKPLLASEE